MSSVGEILRSPKSVTFLVLVVAILFSTTGELFLKAGMDRLGTFSLAPVDLVRAFSSPLILLGFALFGVGAIFWLLVLSRADLSWAYPMLAMGYILVVFESRILFGEEVSPQRWVGALIIVLGVIVMYGSPSSTP